jgi:hypothetical protein
MSNQTPFSLHIFVVDGDPDGMRIVERSNWIGKAVVFPRAIYTRIRKRDEFNQTGVYLLVGPRTNGDGEMIYIGEADPVRPRFEDHYSKKEFWTQAVFFVAGSGNLNKAHVQYLEAKLVNLAIAAKRMPIDNANTPLEPTLSESDRSYMDAFLLNMLGMLPVLGIYAFEQSPSKGTGENVLICAGRGIRASGHDTPQGFVVQAGSFAAGNEVPSLKEHFPGVCKMRADLVERGVLIYEGDNLRFSQSYIFSSPSLASMVVLGRPSNGRTD